MELLEDEADGFCANMVQLGGVEAGDVLSVEPDLAAGGAIEASDEIDHGALAGARRAHHRDPLARRDGERNVIERPYQAAVILFRSRGITLGDIVESNHSNPTFYSPLKMIAGCTRRSSAIGSIAENRAMATLPAKMYGKTLNRGTTGA